MGEPGDDLGAVPTGAAGTAGGALGNASGGRGVYAFYFNIGSVDSFEHAMEEAQEALGVPPNRRVRCRPQPRTLGNRACLRSACLCWTKAGQLMRGVAQGGASS